MINPTDPSLNFFPNSKVQEKKTPPTRAQSTTGDIFTADRNRVRINDFNRFSARFNHYVEIMKILIDLIHWGS